MEEILEKITVCLFWPFRRYRLWKWFQKDSFQMKFDFRLVSEVVLTNKKGNNMLRKFSSNYVWFCYLQVFRQEKKLFFYFWHTQKKGTRQEDTALVILAKSIIKYARRQKHFRILYSYYFQLAKVLIWLRIILF